MSDIRGRRRARLAILLVFALGGSLLAGVVAAPARAATIDLTAAVTVSGDIPIGATATATVVVTNAGTDPSTGTTNATLLLPQNTNATAAAGTGWACTLTSAQRVDCSSTDTVTGAFPAISVDVSGTGTPMAGILYAVASGGGDTDSANNLARQVVRVIQPVSGADQLFLQLSGALTLRSGGNVDTGNLAITRDLFGLVSVTGTATVGSTAATFNIYRRWFPTPFAGTITITDPSLQGGTPMPVNITTGVSDRGNARQVVGNTANFIIPSLDVGGITGALLNGIQINLSWAVGDYAPTAPPPSVTPLLISPAASGLWLDLSQPNRIQTGQQGTIAADVRNVVGQTNGPINIVVNSPAGLTPGTGGSNTSCEIVDTWQICTLNSSLTTPLGLNRSLSGDLRFTPTVPTSIVPLTAFADTPNDPDPNNGNITTANVDVRSPGPDLTLSAVGPDAIPLVGTPALWFQQGSNSANTYGVTVTNTGSASSGAVTVVLDLGAGLTFNSSSGSGWSCSVTTPPSEVTCTRAGLGTSVLNRSATVTVRVDVDAAASPTTTTAMAVSSPGDVAPGTPDKSATVTSPALPPNPTTIAYTFSNGAATLNAPAFAGGYTIGKDWQNKPSKITGCASSRRFVPANLLQLTAARIDDVSLCVNMSRLIFTGLWYGNVTVNDVTGPISLPPPVPPAVPPVGSPFPTSTSAPVLFRPLTQTGPTTFAGSVSATNAQYALTGGARFTIDWNFTLPS